jgi:hypothetical protein
VTYRYKSLEIITADGRLIVEHRQRANARSLFADVKSANYYGRDMHPRDWTIDEKFNHGANPAILSREQVSEQFVV